MHISTQYSEDDKTIVIRCFHDRKLVTKVTTVKATQQTTVEVFKEGRSKPTETYVWNSFDENRQKSSSYAKTSHTHM